MFGVKIHHLPLKSSAKPASGPDFSVPAIGWPGTKKTSLGKIGKIESIRCFFTEPTSVIIVPLLRKGAISHTILSIAPTGTPRTIRSESLTDSRILSSTLSTIFKFLIFSLVSLLLEKAVVSFANVFNLKTRARDEFIKPKPMNVTLLNLSIFI